MATLLKLTGITKAFSGVRALKGVSFDLEAGEVHALVGENGAGKSTLIKVITGAHLPDEGTLEVRGQVVVDNDPVRARDLGIAAIYQQPALFPDLTVAENLALGLEPRGPWRRVRWGQRRARAKQLLGRIGARIDPEADVRRLSMPEQQLVEIARALGADARILIMDEPSASLSDQEVENLFRVIRELKGQGVGIIYISHRLEELPEVADRVTALRDGAFVGTPARCPRSIAAELIRMMVGRELSAVFPKVEVEPGEVVLEAQRARLPSIGRAGRHLPRPRGRNPRTGRAHRRGEDGTRPRPLRPDPRRRRDGPAPGRGRRDQDSGRSRRARDRVCAGGSPQAWNHPRVFRRRQRHADDLARDLPTRPDRLRSRAARLPRTSSASWGSRRLRSTPSVGELSGGNQQKVALAGRLAARPGVLILDEPTQGVDVGAKAEIHRLMGELAGQGMAIVMISSELPEILGMSDRVAVMHGGTIVGTVDRADASQELLLEMALGHGLKGAVGR